MYRASILWLGVCTALLLASGCGPAADDGAGASDFKIGLTLDPSPPTVGDASVMVTLADAGGAKLAGATLRLEGNMNHAGMKPSLADMGEVAPGQYAGTLKFTMGGDWYILVTGKTADGKSLERKFDVPGVKAP